MRRSLAAVHAEFAKDYALDGRSAERLGVHLKRVRGFDDTEDYLQEVADTILFEVTAGLGGRNDYTLCCMLEEADKALNLSGDRFSKHIYNVALNGAINALLDGDVSRFISFIRMVGVWASGARDLQVMARYAGKTDLRFIEMVLWKTSDALVAFPSLPRADRGGVLLRVVLNMCHLQSGPNNHDYAVFDHMDEIVGKLVSDALDTELEDDQ